MEEESSYVVDITPEGETYYYDLLKYLYSTHSEESADRKSDEILDMALSLDKMPNRGSDEDKLAFLGVGHKYLLYEVTTRKTIKIIYFIDNSAKMVYVTDFFPTEMDDSRIEERNQ
ncbi:hypothetical protein SAMN05421640_1171 [Ekhidna lutea]|uniref:ParE toxin of type II toxin-antitoxin system, parDE n=1 Tax=Ekhidna lutea TaxID=447679 RepID=A0A239H7D6_EKHLU|nr:hypothetical protein [Ekhidna lutea]SNS77132.1 hypothetical protein SAMN05421640_1171 [Ekhidna lutea]